MLVKRGSDGVGVDGQQVVDEMAKRHDAAMNPKSNALSTALTSVGFMFHLGLSPASAMVNLTQTALVAYPVMGARWGFAKASGALLKASQEAARGKNDITGALTPDEKAAFDEAVRSGVVDVTMAHDLAGIAQGEDRNVSYKLRPVMRAASFLFHHAEKFNRQVTFIAAYRLAREAGADSQAAYTQAVQATYDGHFDYSANNRPRVMQGNVARVLLLFKQYGQNMVYTFARNALQALKGATPEDRAQARKALAGLLTTHAMAAGVLGLPMVTTLLAAASMIGGDDDEPWDAKVALQNLLADTFGQKPAEVLAHGLSRLTPWDISARVGLDKLIFPDVQEGLEGQRLGESAMAAALGPVAAIGINALKGLQEMSHGRYQLGLEAMAPSVLRGPLKAFRYNNEGVKDKTGIVVQDEVDAAALLGQAAGFSPSSVRNAYEGKSAVVGLDRALQARRSSLVERFAMAAMAKDEEGKTEAREAIRHFNEKNPDRRILPMQLAQSVRAREKRIREAEDGVYLPRKRRDAIEQGRFANEE
ncbi:MAG: PLxRFG domain-containing protein [Comamonas sp.]